MSVEPIDPAAVMAAQDRFDHFYVNEVRAEHTKQDTARDDAEVSEMQDNRDPLVHHHWLMFGSGDRYGNVVGCHCGYRSDLEAHGGYGDDVVDHLLKTARTAGVSSAEVKR